MLLESLTRLQIVAPAHFIQLGITKPIYAFDSKNTREKQEPSIIFHNCFCKLALLRQARPYAVVVRGRFVPRLENLRLPAIIRRLRACLLALFRTITVSSLCS